MKITTLRKLIILIVALRASLSLSADLPQRETSATNPLYIRGWYEAFYEDDSRGILSNIKKSMNDWSYMDEMVKNHDLPSEVRGNVKGRRQFITSSMLKFFERKVSEEGKKSEGNYTFVALAKMNNGLKPGSTVGVSDTFKFKFRGKILQGNGTMVIVNPYLDFNIQYDVRKGAFVEGSKKFEDLDITSTLNYNVKNHLTTFKVNREISQDLNADITYENGRSTHNAGDVSLKLMYSRPF